MVEYDVAVIGAGPGGYVAAIRAAQLGMRAVVIEKDAVGGLCLNWGCIPSKALLYGAEVANLVRRGPEFGIVYRDLTLDIGPAMDRSREVVAKFVGGVETLLKQNKVALIHGAAKLVEPGHIAVEGLDEAVAAKNVIIATGAATRSLPGLTVDGVRVLTSREALALKELPRSVVIVGGGAIGVEFAYLWRAYGAEVTIVELLPRIVPTEDEDVSRQLERSFKAAGIIVRTGTAVEGVSVDATGVTVRVKAGEKVEELQAERVLVGVGFRPNSENLGLEECGVELERGWVKIDGYGATNVPGVWAAGDVTGKLLLAHVASQQGVTAVEKMAGLEPPALDYDKIPRATYCQPQIASLGLSEEQAVERGIEVRTGRFPFRANGKAMATGDVDGFVKLVVDAKTERIIGWHMIGHNATELLGEASLGSVLGATPKQLEYAVHAHPTLGEALKEAALASGGEAIHFYTARRNLTPNPSP